MNDLESVYDIRTALALNGAYSELLRRTDEGARLLRDGVEFVNRRRVARGESVIPGMYEEQVSSVQASESQTTPSNPETPHF